MSEIEQITGGFNLRPDMTPAEAADLIVQMLGFKTDGYNWHYPVKGGVGVGLGTFAEREQITNAIQELINQAKTTAAKEERLRIAEIVKANYGLMRGWEVLWEALGGKFEELRANKGENNG